MIDFILKKWIFFTCRAENISSSWKSLTKFLIDVSGSCYLNKKLKPWIGLNNQNY